MWMAKQLQENVTRLYIIHRLTKANTTHLARLDGTVLKKTVSCTQLKLFINKPASTAVTIIIDKSDESESEAYDSPPAKKICLSPPAKKTTLSLPLLFS
uniref:Uncharacterized protein n=1 Tax=Plectus sambesii TaxID=2011161 RepID=A0A914WTT9_9BILA